LNRIYEDHVAKVEEDLQHQHQHTQPTAATGAVATTSTEHVTQWDLSRTLCDKPKVLGSNMRHYKACSTCICSVL